jgi:20S proteasome subunit alpha 6
LYEFSPSGAYYEYHAMAIGARSQSARTYLEKDVSVYEKATLEELISHALRALRDTLPPDATPGLTAQNTAVGFLGPDLPFKVVDDETQIQQWLDSLPPPPQRLGGEATEEMQVEQ